MRPVIYAISAAATASVFACATSFAAPIAPISTTTSPDHVTQVYYYHHHYYPYYYHGIIIMVEAGIMVTGIIISRHCKRAENMLHVGSIDGARAISGSGDLNGQRCG